MAVFAKLNKIIIKNYKFINNLTEILLLKIYFIIFVENKMKKKNIDTERE